MHIFNITMKKYKIEFIQTETFIVDVMAKDEAAAIKKAQKEWNNGNYHEVGNCSVETGTVYDVTNTDDPFNP